MYSPKYYCDLLENDIENRDDQATILILKDFIEKNPNSLHESISKDNSMNIFDLLLMDFSMDVIKFWIENTKPELNPTRPRCNPLGMALKRLDVCAYLLELGADPNIDLGDQSLLSFAAILKNLPLMSLLYSYGASVDGHRNELRTPLFYCVVWDFVEGCKFLLARGASIEKADYENGADEIIEIFNTYKRERANDQLFDFSFENTPDFLDLCDGPRIKSPSKIQSILDDLESNSLFAKLTTCDLLSVSEDSYQSPASCPSWFDFKDDNENLSDFMLPSITTAKRGVLTPLLNQSKRSRSF